MQQLKTITFIKGDKASKETDYRDSLPVNMSAVIRPIFDSQGYMLETEGLDNFGMAVGIDRGGLWNELFGQHFRLSASKFVSVSATGNVTTIGTILGSTQASLPYSFSTQGIVANNQFWLYDPVGGLVRVTDPNVRRPIDGCWIDGYYCLTDGSYLYHTEIVNGVPVENSINPLAVAVESISPTPVVGVARTTDNFWAVFTRYGIDFYQNVGGVTFAFQRIQARALSIGLVATHAKAFLEDTWFFVGSRKYESLSVFGMQTGGSEKIASREVEKVLSRYSDSELYNISMETRQLFGYSYLILHLPRETLLFNYTISKSIGVEYAWSKLTSGTSIITPWQGINGIFDPRIGKWVYGNRYNASLGMLDDASPLQFGLMQQWYLNTPYINLDTLSVDELEILTVPGFNTDDDATVFISQSQDGEFYGQEALVQYGAPGEYNKRFIKRQLGYVRNFVTYRLRGISRSRMAFSAARIKYG